MMPAFWRILTDGNWKILKDKTHALHSYHNGAANDVFNPDNAE